MIASGLKTSLSSNSAQQISNGKSPDFTPHFDRKSPDFTPCFNGKSPDWFVYLPIDHKITSKCAHITFYDFSVFDFSYQHLHTKLLILIFYNPRMRFPDIAIIVAVSSAY